MQRLGLVDSSLLFMYPNYSILIHVRNYLFTFIVLFTLCAVQRNIGFLKVVGIISPLKLPLSDFGFILDTYFHKYF